MGLKECASWVSVCRGYDYYKENKVLEIKQESETTFTSMVKGSGEAKYNVYIDIRHPRKSKCNCPHADGRRIVCKHQMATFFKAFPEEIEILEREFSLAEQYEEELEDKKERALEKYLDKLSKEELKSEIHYLLEMAPNWLTDIFLQNSVGFDEDDYADEDEGFDEDDSNGKDFEWIDEFVKDELRKERQSKNAKKLAKPVNKYILTMRLRDTNIWRKIAITGTYSFADLHTIIQIAFGWENCHVHQFEVGKLIIGNYDDEEMDLDDCASTFKFEDDVNLEFILLNCKNFVYCYDFGDDWRVDIQVEEVISTQVQEFPEVLEFGGGMAKDDCGGAEALMQMRKRKTNLLELNLILEMTFDI